MEIKSSCIFGSVFYFSYACRFCTGGGGRGDGRGGDAGYLSNNLESGCSDLVTSLLLC